MAVDNKQPADLVKFYYGSESDWAKVTTYVPGAFYIVHDAANNTGKIYLGTSNTTTMLVTTDLSGLSSEIAEEFKKYLPLSGSSAMTGELKMGNNKITGLGTPEAENDAVNKAYVDGIQSDLEDRIGNFDNIMNFRGVATVVKGNDGKVTSVTITGVDDPQFKPGDVVIDLNGLEYVYNTNNSWEQIGNQNDATVVDHESRIGTLEGYMTTDNIGTIEANENSVIGIAKRALALETKVTNLETNNLTWLAFPVVTA